MIAQRNLWIVLFSYIWSNPEALWGITSAVLLRILQFGFPKANQAIFKTAIHESEEGELGKQGY